MIPTASELKLNATNKTSENGRFREAIILYRSAELDALAGPIIDKAYKTINVIHVLFWMEERVEFMI